MTAPSKTPVRLSIDAMGGDNGVAAVAEGLAIAQARGLEAAITLHGKEGELRTALASQDLPGGMPDIVHTEDVITMEDKPTAALRRKDSSMWKAIAQVKAGEADSVVSAGNTGALMAMSVLQLRKIEGIDRPAITATWPTQPGGRSVVLDVGANVEADARHLVQFAIMGEAYFRALTGNAKPKVGLLNVGSEELKGHGTIREAASTLREADPEMRFLGFVEGTDIGSGRVDVVVTDGFTGNIALKTAEGTARLVGGWMKDALTTSWRSKLGAAMMMGPLKGLKEKLNPSHVNGAPLLGLQGLVIKSHGGADAHGIASAMMVAATLARHPFQDEIARRVAAVDRRAGAEQDGQGQERAATAAAE